MQKDNLYDKTHLSQKDNFCDKTHLSQKGCFWQQNFSLENVGFGNKTILPQKDYLLAIKIFIVKVLTMLLPKLPMTFFFIVLSCFWDDEVMFPQQIILLVKAIFCYKTFLSLNIVFRDKKKFVT